MFSWNCLASLAFLAWGRIMNNQNTKIMPPNKIKENVPLLDGEACNKTTNWVIVLFFDFRIFRLPFFLLNLHIKMQFTALRSFGVCIYKKGFVVHPYASF